MAEYPVKEVGLTFRGDIGDAIAKMASLNTQFAKFTRDNESKFKRLGTAWQNSLGKLTSPLAGFVGGAGIMLATKRVVDLDTAFAKMAQKSQMSLKSIYALKDPILAVSMAAGVSVNSLTDLSGAALESSNSLSFVQNNLPLMTRVMQATGATAESVGAAMGEINKETGMAGKSLEQFYSKLYGFASIAGREGTLKDVLPQTEQLTKIANLTSRDVQSVFQQAVFTGNPEAVTRAYRMMLTGGKPIKSILKTLGFGKEIAAGITPDLALVIAQIKKQVPKAEQQGVFTRLFGGRSIIGLEKLINDTDRYAEANKKADPTLMMQRAAEQANTLAAAQERLATAVLKIADSALGKTLRDWGNALAAIPAEKMDAYLKWLKNAAMAVTALWAGLMLFKTGKSLFELGGAVGGLFKAGGKAGGGAAGGVGGMFGLYPGSTPGNPMYVVVVGGRGIPGAPGAGINTGLLKGIGVGILAAEVTAIALSVIGFLQAKHETKVATKDYTPEALKKRQKAHYLSQGYSEIDAESLSSVYSKGANKTDFDQFIADAVQKKHSLSPAPKQPLQVTLNYYDKNNTKTDWKVWDIKDVGKNINIFDATKPPQ
jgi:hypothetical protein